MMIWAVIWGAIVAAVGSLIDHRPLPRGHRKMRWWNVIPSAQEGNAQVTAEAVATLRRRWGLATWATVVRVGKDDDDSDVYLGVGRLGGGSDQASVAEVLAKGAGSSLGEEVPYPNINISNQARWYWTQPAEDENVHIDEGDIGILSRPAREEQLEEFASRYGEISDSYLEAGDALIVSFAPLGKGRGRKMLARAATTNRSVGCKWSFPGPDTPRMMLPDAGAFACWIGVLLCGFAVCAGFGFLGVGASARSTGSSTVLGIIFGLAAVGSAVMGTWTPRQARILGKVCWLPMRWPYTRKLAVLDTKQTAGWITGGDQAAVATPIKNAPEELLEPNGIPFGSDAADRTVYFRDEERQNGLLVFGDPGSGKTTLMLSAWKQDIVQRMSGRNRTLIWLETKGAGADRAEQVALSAGCQPCVINVAEKVGPRIELVDWSNPREAAELITASMVYAFDPGWIEGRSEAVLTAVLQAVIGADPSASQACGYPSYPNILRMSSHLLGGERATGAEEQARAALRDHANPNSIDLLSYLPPYATKRDAEQLVQAARGKLQLLLAGESLFEIDMDPKRGGQLTLPEMLGGVSEYDEPIHPVVIINLAASRSVRSSSGYSDTTATRLGAMIFYCLWDAIQKHCDEWQAAGRSVAIYSDELSDIAGLGGGNLDVVREMAFKGRSRGVELMLASQQYDQIPERTMKALSGFGTRVFFHAESPEIAEFASEHLEKAFSGPEISALPPFTCAARMRYNRVGQAPFLLYPENVG